MEWSCVKVLTINILKNRVEETESLVFDEIGLKINNEL